MDSAWNFRQYRKPTDSEQGNWGAGRARRFLKRTQKRTSRATSGKLWGKPEEAKPRYLDPYTQSGGTHHCGGKLPKNAPSNICWRILGKALSALFPHNQKHFPMRKSATSQLSCLTGLTRALQHIVQLRPLRCWYGPLSAALLWLALLTQIQIDSRP